MRLLDPNPVGIEHVVLYLAQEWLGEANTLKTDDGDHIFLCQATFHAALSYTLPESLTIRVRERRKHTLDWLVLSGILR